MRTLWRILMMVIDEDRFFFFFNTIEQRERKVIEEWVNEGKESEIGMARKKVR